MLKMQGAEKFKLEIQGTNTGIKTVDEALMKKRVFTNEVK